MKTNNRLKTVSVGICAFNEEKNILSILKDILAQEHKNYQLKNIMVFSDGSTDKTNVLLLKASKKIKSLKVFINNKRRGKVYGLNKLYKSVKSDILITLDADVNLKGTNVLDNMASYFSDKKVGLVYGNLLPTEPKNFFQRIVVTYEYFWRRTINKVNEGNNIHNSLGCLMGLSKKFYQTLHVPSDVVAEDHYIYLFSIKKGFKNVFAKDSIAYFISPRTLKDYMIQFSRYSSSQGIIEEYFGNLASKFYYIPRSHKLISYLESFFRSPFFMILAILLQIHQRINIKSVSRKKVLWDIALTSK